MQEREKDINETCLGEAPTHNLTMIFNNGPFICDTATLSSEKVNAGVGYYYHWSTIDEGASRIAQILGSILLNYCSLLQIANTSKKEGPVGPPGYNGTRGSPGVSGPPGPPGFNGTQGLPGTSPTGGDLTLCSYQEKKSPEVTSDNYASTDVSVNEAHVGLN